jgi:hypothetical protein
VFNIHGVTVTAAALCGLHRPLSANQIYLMLVVWNGTKDVDLGSKQIEHTAASGSGCVHPILHPMRSRRTYFGFLAPVLAKQSPAVLDSINDYLPVVIVNGLAALLFMIGYALFGVAVIRTATPPRWAGVLVAVGAPAHLLGFGIAQLVSTAAWPIAIVGSVSLGAGLAWPGYRLWHAPFTRGPEDSRAKEFWRPWIRRLHDLRHLVESAHESLWLPRGSLGHCPRLCQLSKAGSDSPFQAR